MSTCRFKKITLFRPLTVSEQLIRSHKPGKEAMNLNNDDFLDETLKIIHYISRWMLMWLQNKPPNSQKATNYRHLAKKRSSFLNHSLVMHHSAVQLSFWKLRKKWDWWRVAAKETLKSWDKTMSSYSRHH